MNRTEYNELLDDIMNEIEERGGNFQNLYGGDEETIKNARLIASVAIFAVDRYYAKLTRMKLEHPNI